MRKKLIRTLLLGAILLAWLTAFFFQHLACFDIFETNALRLYVLACGFLAVQCAVLILAVRQRYPVWLFIGHSVLHGICAFFAAKVIFTAYRYSPMPLGLFICSLILDIAGFLFCVLLAIYTRKRK